MDYVTKGAGSAQTVCLSGRFTFSDHGNFKQIIDGLVADRVETCTLDFQGVEFIDSSGLGMLLILREALEKVGGKVTLLAPQGQVEKMLRISQFDQMFAIKAA